MYTAVGVRRHLLHGLTSVGVAAAYYANLLVEEACHKRVTHRLETKLEQALDKVMQLESKLADLQKQHRDEHGEAQATSEVEAQLADAKAALRDANQCLAIRSELWQDNQTQLLRLHAEIAAIRGALPVRCCGPLACVPPCRVIPTRSLLLRPPLAIMLLPLVHVRLPLWRPSMRQRVAANNKVRRCPRGCCAWLVPLHSLTPAGWCGLTVLTSCPPARMLCNAPCHLPSLLVCHLSVLVVYDYR